MKLKYLLLSLTLTLAFCDTTDYTYEDGVIVLTKQNFNQALEDFPYLLVNFYISWCPNCRRLNPIFAAAAQHLAETNSHIKIAKIDIPENQEIHVIYGIPGTHTIQFFTKGIAKPVEYTGEKSKTEMINWLNRQVGSVSFEVNSVQQLDKILSENDIVALFIGTFSSFSYGDFVKCADDLTNVLYVHSNSKEVKEKYGVADDQENILFLFNNKDASVYVSKDLPSLENFKTFIAENQEPAVVDYSDHTIERAAEKGLEVLILFKGKRKTDEDAEIAFRNAAKELKKEIVFSVVTFDDHWGGRVAGYLDVEEWETPTVRLIQSTTHNDKYKLEGDITEENIRKFIADFREGRLAPFTKSEYYEFMCDI